MTTNPRHPARERSSVTSIVTLVCLSLVLGACQSTGVGTWGNAPGEGRAARLAMNGDHSEAAGVYIGLASEATGSEKDRLTMLAVEQWLGAGDAARARNAFRRVPRQSVASLRWLWNTNSAALSLYAGEPDDALSILEPMSRESLTQNHRLRVEALRADAWIQKRDPARAIELMTQRESWLTGRRSIEQNRWRLWQGLLVSEAQVLRASAELTLNDEVKGWLSLGSLAASTGQQGIGWANGAVRWRETHSGHPAMLIIGRMQLPDELILDYPHQIALLLPLSGRTAAAGKAIQNGFMGAYFSTVAGLDDPQTVRIYDVSTEGGASAAYATAVADGAEFVIGPLLKNNVVALANDILVPVPVLTLNYLPENTLAPPGLYQFALAPEDEARSAAQYAHFLMAIPGPLHSCLTTIGVGAYSRVSQLSSKRLAVFCSTTAATRRVTRIIRTRSKTLWLYREASAGTSDCERILVVLCNSIQGAAKTASLFFSLPTRLQAAC